MGIARAAIEAHMLGQLAICSQGEQTQVGNALKPAQIQVSNALRRTQNNRGWLRHNG